MKTKDVYYKVYATTDLPVVRLSFTFKDNNDVIQLCGGSLCLRFDDGHDKNIRQMEKMEDTPGFMFWNNSTEGKEFFNKNREIINECLTNMVFKQK